MAAAQQTVNEFTSRTGADEDVARFFLDAGAWNLEAAIGMFLDESGGAQLPQQPSKPVQAQPQQQPQSQQPTRQPVAASTQRKGVRGFSDYRDDDSGAAGGKKPQNYFTGGHTSGMMVEDPQGPPDEEDEDGGNDMVSTLMRSARKHAESQPSREPEQKEQFAGSGYRLGNTTGAASTPVPTAKSNKPQINKHVLTFWKSGFTVDDGELRGYDDPANAAFVEAVNKGVAPPELSKGGDIDIKLIDNRGEEYKAPPKVLKPFSGAGQTLGATTTSTTAPIPTTTSSSSNSSAPAIDESKPLTTLQLRLHDGTRLVAKFNLTNTVGDIRAFVNRAIPGGSHLRYQLQTTFPVQVLSNDTQTIAQANLQNAVIIQKLT